MPDQLTPPFSNIVVSGYKLTTRKLAPHNHQGYTSATCLYCHKLTIQTHMSFTFQVMKFGGSSIQDHRQMNIIASIVKGSYNNKQHPVVVLSAMGKTTEDLITAARYAVKSELVETSKIEQLHLTTAKELNIESSIVDDILTLLKQCKRILKVSRQSFRRSSSLLFSTRALFISFKPACLPPIYLLLIPLLTKITIIYE